MTAMPQAETIRQMLAPGKSLDAGRVWEVVELIEGQPHKLAHLIECLSDENPAIASRAADALERVTRDRPHQAQRWKDALLGLLADTTEKKIRWNLALLIPRLKLTVAECRRTAKVLNSYLDDPSSIVKTAALHGMADLTRQDPESLPEVLEMLRLAARSGTPAMRARSRILLKAFECQKQKRKNRSSIHMFD
jgi:HEAT repeat protein